MREFIYFSSKAQTSGNFSNLMQAGRMDIVIHFIINTLFLSNKMREDVRLHLIFYGSPDPPKHLIFESNLEMPISKKDVAGLIKRMLFKYKSKKTEQIYPGCFIDRKNFFEVIDEKIKEGKKIFLLDKKGEVISNLDLGNNCVFIFGDHEGLPKKEMKRLKNKAKSLSLGKKVYFASQTATIVNYLIDQQGKI